MTSQTLTVPKYEAETRSLESWENFKTGLNDTLVTLLRRDMMNGVRLGLYIVQLTDSESGH